VAGAEAACRAGQVDHLQPSGSDRYQALFDARPGYPAAVAFLQPVTGLKGALWLVPIASTLIAGLLVWALLRLLGASPRMATAGQVLLYVLPVGWWGSQMLTEGPVLLGATGAVLGAVMCLDHRPVAGGAVLAAGLGVAAVVKHPTATLIALAVAGAAVVSWWCGANRPGAIVAGSISAGTTAGLFTLTATHQLPGLNDTLQDLLTGHFAAPDVADPMGMLVATNARYWPAWLTLSPMNLALLVSSVVAVWALWKVWKPAALTVAAVAAVGIAAAIAHPDPFEVDRLYSLLWLLPAVGLPMAAQVRQRERSPRPQP
jgi:hypothetical protein